MTMSIEAAMIVLIACTLYLTYYVRWWIDKAFSQRITVQAQALHPTVVLVVLPALSAVTIFVLSSLLPGQVLTRVVGAISFGLVILLVFTFVKGLRILRDEAKQSQPPQGRGDKGGGGTIIGSGVIYVGSGGAGGGDSQRTVLGDGTVITVTYGGGSGGGGADET
jgi:hypothetical protein